MQLHLKDGNKIIDTVEAGSWVTLPDGSMLSPAVAGWSNGDYSLVEVPPPPAPTPEEALQAERAGMQLSFAQMIIGLVAEQWITQADGEGWLAGILPPTVIATIHLLPQAHQFAAKAKATRPSYVARLDPLVEMMALAQKRSPAEIDAFFRTYATA
jgi:hypothetical protein